MDIFKIEALITQGKTLTSSNIDSDNDYVQVGKYVPNNRKRGGSANTYESFAVPISQISPVLVGSFSVSASQMRYINSNPILMVPAPGAGYTVKVLDCSYEFTAGATPFTGLTELDVITDTAGDVQMTDSASFIAANISGFISLRINNPTTNTTLVENQPVFFKGDADPAPGDGTMKVYFSYRIIKNI